MFEAAELGRQIANAEYKQEVPKLREALLTAQARLRDCPFPVIIVFAGVDGAGKGETANLINAWMDPRGVATRAYDRPSDEEMERPRNWRYWRDLPSSGKVGVFLSAWYSEPIVQRVYKDIDEETFEQRLQRIRIFERKLGDGGALILKFWMHLGKKAQKQRLKSLEKDATNSWRVA
jgi:polyphosphate kinase 2 (PPK2 family)